MKFANRVPKWALLLAAVCSALTFGVTGCSSPVEKANKFYERGTALLKEGDLIKARIEFQNALQIKQDLAPAWYGMALVAEGQADWAKMHGFLSKVVDLDPKHLEAQTKLGRLLLAAGQLDKALAASDAALALAKDSADVLSLRAAVLYKLDDTKAALEHARLALEKDPKSVDALVVLATERLAAKDANAAIALLDRGLAINEKNIALQLMKVQAFESVAKLDAAEQVFKRLVALYPETRALRHILAQFYLSHGNQNAAEAEYRAVAAENPNDTSAQLDVVRFVNSMKGTKAAIAELESLIAKAAGTAEYKFALAGLHQGSNDRKAAEAVLKSVIEAGKDNEDAIRAKGMLAANLLADGKRKDAEMLVAEILAKDARNEQGVLLKAGLAIEDRQFEQAIADLRTLLRDAPNSARANLMLGRAHELGGSPELAQERYLAAYEGSKKAPAVGMTLAEFLLRRGQASRAIDVAEEVLRGAPEMVPMLKLLAQAQINQGNWAAAQEVADKLGKIASERRTADTVRGAIAVARKNYSESIASFKRAFDAAPTELQPMVALVRSYLLAGKTAEALAFVNSVTKASPNNANAFLLLGQLSAMKGDTAAAQQAFKTLISLQPKDSTGYVNLANLNARAGKATEAQKLVDEGLTAVPGDFALRVTRAGLYESAGQFEDAIKIYEELLKERPGADVIANNLASLLSDHRSDKASLARAHDLALRFKRSEVPQFKDTLGWTSHKVGKADEAIDLIGDATKKLPELAVFRYHLGMSYLAANKKEDARRELEHALELGKRGGFAEEGKVKEALAGLR